MEHQQLALLRTFALGASLENNCEPYQNCGSSWSSSLRQAERVDACESRFGAYYRHVTYWNVRRIIPEGLCQNVGDLTQPLEGEDGQESGDDAPVAGVEEEHVRDKDQPRRVHQGDVVIQRKRNLGETGLDNIYTFTRLRKQISSFLDQAAHSGVKRRKGLGRRTISSADIPAIRAYIHLRDMVVRH